jgi:predicted phosphodiesterase
MTRVAIVSDIHGNLAALEAVAADIKTRQVDQVVNLGDNLSGPLLPQETARFLMSSDWLSLAGNHERQILELRPGHGGPSDRYAASQLSDAELSWLRLLRSSFRFSDDLYLCHGTPASDCHYLLETVSGSSTRLATAQEIDARLGGERSPVIACGHTHIPRAVRTDEGQLLLNPGSVGLQAYQDNVPAPHSVELGSPDARYAILERGPTGWIVQHLCVPYDYESMAALARRRGRPEWEKALLTGYV